MTFTYDDTKSTKLETMYLQKNALQKLFKRIRHHHKIKYYACGEYGETFKRPHFHGLILRETNNPIPYEKYWTKGNVHLGSITDASIAYCTGYLLKANAVPANLPKDALPFHIWSRGIGDRFMTGKTFLDMAREGNIPRRWRALADPKEIPDEKYLYPKDTLKGWQRYGRRKQQQAFHDGRS